MRFWNLIPGILFGLLSHAQNGNDYYQRALEFKEQKDFENAIVETLKHYDIQAIGNNSIFKIPAATKSQVKA